MATTQESPKVVDQLDPVLEGGTEGTTRVDFSRPRDWCPIGCDKATHCEGCDQCDPTTRRRHARLRRPSLAMRDVDIPVNYCDECTQIVNAGEHDEFREVVR